MCYPLSFMADETPLTDEQVYELIHQIRLMLSGRTVATELGQKIIGLALRDIVVIQTAMTTLMDEKQPPP
jgi:hypothetical protein